MATNIKNIFEQETGLKQDFREDWTETTRADWRIDWKSAPSNPTPVRAPTISAVTAAQTFNLAAAGTVVALSVTATDPNTPVLPLTYQWSLHTGHALTFAPIQTPTLASAHFIVPSVVGDWSVGITVSNGSLETVRYVAVRVNP